MTWEIGQVYMHSEQVERYWPNMGPFLVIRRIGSTLTWEVLDMMSSRITYLIGSEDNMKFYQRIA